MHKKLIALAVAGAALAVPASASALAPAVYTTAQSIEGTDQYAWSCVGRALPPINSFTLTCNGQRAVGTGPVLTISGVSTGTPGVCWSGSFNWGSPIGQWANYSGCREGEHLPV